MADEAATGTLPRFERPPVVEVAIGVEFLPLPALTVVPLVELRPIWLPDYPHVEEQPAIRPSPGDAEWAFELAAGVPPIRLWLLSPDRTELLQLQNDRLILNWRADGTTEYPHYKQLEPRFTRSWGLLSEAVAERSLGALQPILAEVTYVNRFALEPGETLFDALSIFSPSVPLRRAEPAIQMRIDLPMQDLESRSGQQTISAGRFRGDPDKVELTLVTRVEIMGTEPSPIECALRHAHEIAARSFAEVTTAMMHERWGRTQ